MSDLTAKIRMLVAGLLGLGLVGCSLYHRGENDSDDSSVRSNQHSEVAADTVQEKSPVRTKALFDQQAAVYQTVVGHQPAQDIDHPLFNTEQTRWIFMFNDPALVELVEKALEHNASLLAQAARVKSLEDQARAARVKMYPSLSLGLNQNPNTARSLESPEELSQTAQLELQRWQALSDETQALSLAFAREKNAFSQQALHLTKTVATAWYKLNYLRKQSELVQQRIDTLKNALRVVEQGISSEQYSSLNLAQRQEALSEGQGHMQFLQQLITEQVVLLQSLTGVTLDQKQLAMPMLPALNELSSFSSLLLAQQPQLQDHWLTLLQHYPERAIVNKEYFPVQVFSLGEPPADKTIYTLDNALSTSIMPASALLSNEVNKKYLISEQERKYQRKLSDTVNKINTLLGDETAMTRQIETGLQKLSELRENTQKVLRQYTVGQISLQQLLNSQKEMLDHEANILFSRHQQLQNRVILNSLVGGLPTQTIRSNQAL